MIEANNQHIPRSGGWGIKRQNDLAPNMERRGVSDFEASPEIVSY
jgi:hypothetical protein